MKRILTIVAFVAAVILFTPVPAQTRTLSRTIAPVCWTRDGYNRYCYYTVYERDPWTSKDFPHYSLVASGYGYQQHFSVPYNTEGWVQAIVAESYCNGYGQIVSFPAYSGYQWVGLAIPCG